MATVLADESDHLTVREGEKPQSVHDNDTSHAEILEINAGKLSLRSPISTSISRIAGAMPENERREYTIIGRGSAGTVFKIPELEQSAIKKGPNTDALWNDFLLTNAVHVAFNETRELLQCLFPQYVIPRTPACTQFWKPDCSEYWQPNLERYPTSHRSLGTAFLVDRIPSVPQIVREQLIERYFEDDERVQEEAKKDEQNKSCLMRIYLGENEPDDRKDMCYDSLENFPMRLNMIEDYIEDKELLATEMAIALAVIHWQAQVDGMDCEFVLGSSIPNPPERRRPVIANEKSVMPGNARNITETAVFNRREVSLWVIDFDKASRIELIEEDVDRRLVTAFLGNDPYFPRPDGDEDLWAHFAATYRTASTAILSRRKVDSTVEDLPQRFLDKVEAKVQELGRWKLEEQVIFR